MKYIEEMNPVIGMINKNPVHSRLFRDHSHEPDCALRPARIKRRPEGILVQRQFDVKIFDSINFLSCPTTDSILTSTLSSE